MKSSFAPLFPSKPPPRPGDEDYRVVIQPIYLPDGFRLFRSKPQSREEAIYLLAVSGADILNAPATLIGAFCNIYRQRESIKKYGYFIDLAWNLRENIIKNTQTVVERWVETKPFFFKALPDMAWWLQGVLCQAGYGDALSIRCAHKQEWEAVVKEKYSELNISTLETFSEELTNIAISYNGYWTLETYLRLILQYARSIRRTQGTSENELKKQFWNKLKKNGLCNIRIPDYLDGDLEEYVPDQHSDIITGGLQQAFKNHAITFSQLTEQIKKALNTINSTVMANRITVTAGDSYHAIPNTDGLLKTSKQYSREFFIWFCLAYVETSLAVKMDPHVGTGITAWTIYEKMRELNKDIHTLAEKDAPEKVRKKEISPRISKCKSHLISSLNLAPQKNILSEAEIAKCIDSFRQFPEMSKYFCHTRFIQRFIKQGDRDKTKLA